MALLRDNLFVDGLDNLVLSAENLSEANTVDLFQQFPATSSSVSRSFVITALAIKCIASLATTSYRYGHYYYSTVAVQTSHQLMAVLYHG